MKMIPILAVAVLLDSCGSILEPANSDQRSGQTKSPMNHSESNLETNAQPSSDVAHNNEEDQSAQAGDINQSPNPSDIPTQSSPSFPEPKKEPKQEPKQDTNPAPTLPPTAPVPPSSPSPVPSPVPNPIPKPSNANIKLFDYYTTKNNYDRVFSEVLTFYPAGRSNGCVAFLSSALRQSGTPVPKDLWLGGYNVSLVTIALSDYLKSLNWLRIDSPKELKPGDIVMTLPPKEYPGIPAHTYMFQSWKDQKRGIGLVIDNQDFTHERNIFGTGTYNFTPFWYALREK